jgi:hypothetical protein
MSLGSICTLAVELQVRVSFGSPEVAQEQQTAEFGLLYRAEGMEVSRKVKTRFTATQKSSILCLEVDVEMKDAEAKRQEETWEEPRKACVVML